MPPIVPKPKPEPLPTSPYKLHPRIAKFFAEFVVKPFEQHYASRAWTKEVTKTDWKYQANTILDNGRASFMEDKNGLSPADQVLVYCYRYMQMHVVSGFHMFLRNYVDHKIRLMSNPIFIDFGCGPLTSAISLAWYNLVAGNKTQAEAAGLKFHYIGIDRSEAMLAHAQRATVTGGLFHNKSTFDFVTRYNAREVVPRLIDKYRGASGSKEKFTVILNCSYYFGSRTLDVKKLIRLIGDLMENHLQDDKVCLAFQNASHSGVNSKWEEFKAEVKDILDGLYCVWEDLEYHDITGRRHQGNPHRIRLRRELLLNKKWQDELKEGKKK